MVLASDGKACLAVLVKTSLRTNSRRFKMQTARIFVNGRSQAVRLPKAFRFSGTEVYIKRMGNMVILLPKDDPWAPLINSLNQFTDDFMQTRDQPTQVTRPSL
jgi:antitoxin VapB